MASGDGGSNNIDDQRSNNGRAIPEMTYTCEICGRDGFDDEEMRSHMALYHLKGADNCPFCDLGEISPAEMLLHVNSAHLDYLTPRFVPIICNYKNNTFANFTLNSK